MKAVSVSPVFCCWHQLCSQMEIISKCSEVFLSNFCSLTGLEYPRLLSMLFSLLVSQISIKVYFCFELEGRQTWREAGVRKSKISASHCCLTVSSSQAVLCSPVSCLLRTPDSWIRLLPLLLRVQCSAPAQSGPGAGLNYFARDLRPPRNIELYKDIICYTDLKFCECLAP